jgi:cell division protein FtsB
MSRGERLAIIITLAVATLITGPWFYFQLLVWKAEGHDYMLSAGNVVVTLLLWASLVYVIRLWIVQVRRADSRQASMDNRSAQQVAELQSENKKLRDDVNDLRKRVGDLEQYNKSNYESGIRKSARLLAVRGLLLGNSIEALKTAGECEQLAWHAQNLRQELIGTFQQLGREGNREAIEALAYPLAVQIPTTDSEWKWYDRSISKFGIALSMIRMRTGMLSLKEFDSKLLRAAGKNPDAHQSQLTDGLREYSDLITIEARQRVTNYRDSVEEIVSD